MKNFYEILGTKEERRKQIMSHLESIGEKLNHERIHSDRKAKDILTYQNEIERILSRIVGICEKPNISILYITHYNGCAIELKNQGLNCASFKHGHEYDDDDLLILYSANDKIIRAIKITYDYLETIHKPHFEAVFRNKLIEFILS